MRRFLGRLKTSAMTDATTDAGVTVVTIKNYDRYQRPIFKNGASADGATDAVTAQHRREEEGLEVRKEEGGGVLARMPVPAAVVAAGKLAEEIGIIAGYPDPLNWPPGWCGAPLRVQAWLAEPGWTRDIILIGCREAMATKRDGPPFSISFFEKPIARAIGRQAVPLPKINEEIVNADTRQGSRRHRPAGGGAGRSLSGLALNRSRAAGPYG